MGAPGCDLYPTSNAVKRYQISEAQERLMFTSLRAGCLPLYLSDWTSARPLVRLGYGLILDEKRTSKRVFGRFVLLPTGIAKLEEVRARSAAQSVARRDPLYHARALAAAARAIHVKPEALLERSKYRLIVHARWAVMLSMAARGIGPRRIGHRVNRDHSSVRYGLREARELIAKDAAFAALVRKVEAA